VLKEYRYQVINVQFFLHVVLYIVHWLVICCNCMQNARYTQFQYRYSIFQPFRNAYSKI